MPTHKPIKKIKRACNLPHWNSANLTRLTADQIETQQLTLSRVEESQQGNTDLKIEYYSKIYTKRKNIIQHSANRCPRCSGHGQRDLAIRIA